MDASDALVVVAGEELILSPHKALFWPRRSTLIVADAHFGKAASFRARGVPVPEATTAVTLAALDALIARHDARRIVFLGDFLHARDGRGPHTLAALSAWRSRHARLALVLVEGNHDASAGAPPAALGMALATEPLADAPFALCHLPVPVPGRYVLAGHLHPACRIAGRRDAVRLPCFWFGAHVGVLPAFGAFTGAHTIVPAAGDRVYVVAGERVLRVPERQPA
ncbi:MAG: ligase-associated DNA damage response endonuclease PdeM [Burkholderiales bacterium]|nr:ligase-associated DNA damage response endonuclease PdeM [Burkholderiales bacterium]